MPPKRAMGNFSDYAPQMKQRRTWDSLSESNPQNMQNSPSVGPSTIDSWYNAPSSYKPGGYDSGYYNSGNVSYSDGAGTYNESMGSYGNRSGGGYGSGTGEFGTGVGSYDSGNWQRDSNSQAPFGGKTVQQKRPGATEESAGFMDDMALVGEAEKHFRQTRGASFLNTLKSAMDIVQSMESNSNQQYFGMNDDGNVGGGGWGYDQGWGNYSRGGRGQYGSRGSSPRGFAGRGARAAGRWGQSGGRGFGRGTGTDFGFQGASSQKGRGADRGQGQMQGGKRGRGQVRGGKPGFQNQTFQNLNRRGGHMAPVHSLSTVQAKSADLSLSLPEKIRRFCLFCINEGDKVNEIQTIENALTASKLGLKSEFNIGDVNGKLFSGALFLDGVFIARCASKKKKQAKHDCYAKALSVMRTKTVTQIMALKDDGPESVLPDQATSPDMTELMESIASDVGGCPQGSCMPNKAVPGLHKLTKYLKTRQATNNCIQSHVQELEQAFTASHSELTHSYDVDIVKNGGKTLFRGRLHIEGILFAGAVDAQKKKAKQKVSEQAVNYLITQSIGTLVRGKSLKDLEIDEPSLTENTPVVGQVSEKDLLEKFVTNLKSNTDLRNRISVLNKFAAKLGISVTSMFRRVDEKIKMLECKLFVSGLLLAIGKGETFHESRHDAYNKAFEICFEDSVDDIMMNCRRINKSDTDDPDRLDGSNKGKKKMEDSNLMRLKRIANFDLEESLKNNVDEMVIMEHSDWAADRKRNAFCILSETALQNRMLLEWNMNKTDKLFTCTMSLQKKILAEVSALNKVTARSLASAAVLFKLYETHPVVVSSSKNLPNIWILYEDVRKHAQKLKEQSGETGSIDDDMVKLEFDIKPESKTEGEDMNGSASENVTDSPSGRKFQNLQYNKWVVQYVEQLIKDYAGKEVVDELIFSSGLPVGDQKRISLLAREYGLKFGRRTFQGQAYSSINKRLSLHEIFGFLQNGLPSRRYSLVPSDDLPCYKDIVNDIAEAENVQETPVE